jgi:purine-binding chemotaxis protein CheW
MTTAMKDTVKQEQYLTFLLANEEYAVNILKVKEIIEYDTVTAVPNTPRWVRGVINLRGAVVPVVDLTVKFGQGGKAVTKTTCIVIVEALRDDQHMTIGVIADAVSQVIDLRSEDIQSVPEFGTKVRTDYLLGIGRSGNKFCLILDVDKVLTTSELSEVAESLLPDATESTETTLAASEVQAVTPASQPQASLEA